MITKTDIQLLNDFEQFLKGHNNMTKITVSEKYGREVTANQLIQTGQVLFNCELLVLSKQDTVLINQTDLQYYTFKFNDEQDCLVLGHGEIFNHSDTPNVAYNIVTIEDRSMMQFVALKDIEVNEQCFIDYSYDIPVHVESYVNKNLI